MGLGKEQEPAVRGDAGVKSLGFLGPGQGIGLAGEDQDRHVRGDAADRPDRCDVVKLGDKNGPTVLSPK